MTRLESLDKARRVRARTARQERVQAEKATRARCARLARYIGPDDRGKLDYIAAVIDAGGDTSGGMLDVRAGILRQAERRRDGR